MQSLDLCVNALLMKLFCTLYSDPESHNAQRHRPTDGHDNANSRSHCDAMLCYCCAAVQKHVASSSLTEEIVIRSCSEATVCTSGGSGFGNLANSHTYCCNEDLCNGTDVILPPSNYLLPVAVSLLISIFVL